MNNYRHYSWMDQFCLSIDQAIRAVFDAPKTTGRAYPAEQELESEMTLPQRKLSQSLMRVNHAGEVCAQALYHGQGLVSRCKDVQQQMQQAADEEGDHLQWCSRRLFELGSHTSYLNPVWYIGSFTLGVTAGMMGDKWSLGFLAETESQVVQHLEKHLNLLTDQDKKSYKILQQMQQDEAQHQTKALEAGARELPLAVKKLMTVMSKLMVRTAFWV